MHLRRISTTVAVLFLTTRWARAVTDKTCSGESHQRIGRASDCIGTNDWGCAKIAVDSVLRQQPGCALAVYIKSLWLENEGQLDDAKRYRDQAEKLNPDLKSFWEKRGHAIEESTLTQQEFSHFVLKFNGAGNRDNAWKAVQHLNQAYDFMASRFEATPAKKIEVIVFTGQEFVDAWRAQFIGGFFDRRDGKVRVRVDEFPGGEELFRHICRHEFTHAFLYQLYSKELPLWFVEGAAEFYGSFDTSTNFWQDSEMERVRKLVKAYPAPKSLDVVSDVIKKKDRSPGEIYLAYQYGYALTLYMAKQRGDSWIPSLIRHLRQGETFDQAFQSVVGYSPTVAYEHLLKSWDWGGG